MNDIGRAARWRQLIEEEKRAYARALSAEDKGGAAKRENLSREWFAALGELMSEHSRSHIAPHEDGPLEPYPVDAIVRVSNLMKTLAAGRVPQIVKDISAAGGRPGRWPLQRRDIAIALRYIDLVKDKKIKQRAFNRTVAEAFGVDRTTVQSWWKARDKYLSDIPDTPADQFPRKLHEAGARYRFNETGERTEGVE